MLNDFMLTQYFPIDSSLLNYSIWRNYEHNLKLTALLTILTIVTPVAYAVPVTCPKIDGKKIAAKDCRIAET